MLLLNRIPNKFISSVSERNDSVFNRMPDVLLKYKNKNYYDYSRYFSFALLTSCDVERIFCYLKR